MPFELTARTGAGQKFVEAAADLISMLREHAALADRDNTMSEDSFAALKKAGITSAFVPEELGGFGVDSVHDWLVGIGKLAEGDVSVAIAINMHLAVCRGIVQGYQAELERGGSADGVAAMLSAIAAGRMLICATATERGTDTLHPYTTAVKTDSGWVINGHKMFVTMSPLATHLAMNLRMQDEDGEHLGTTLLPIDTPGIVPQDDWDALGMRGSGSQSVKLENVTYPRCADSVPGVAGASRP